MSTGNPYAAKSSSKARKVSGASEGEDKTEVVVAPAGNVSEVLKWVGDDPERAQVALDAENSGHKRKTLMSKLSDVISNGANR